MSVATPAPGALARFQDGFSRALFAPATEPAQDMAALTAQPAFAVYRNTVLKGCIDALADNHPAVVRLVGEEWFRAAAALFVREQAPADPRLVYYGAGFADFLARFAPAAELPYLPGVARLDRYWCEAHVAPDAPPLEPALLTRLDAQMLARVVLDPHPAARWAWFAEGPICTIWSRNRAPGGAEGELDWQAEGALLTRPHDAVNWTPLDAAGCAFLDACAAGHTLATAAARALAAQDDANLERLMATLITAGAFNALHLID